MPRRHQIREGAIGHLHRNRKGHRDNLCAHGFVELPAESVVGAVAADHGFRRGLRGFVTFQAGLRCTNRLREEEIFSGGSIALPDELVLVGMVAETVDDVGLPVGGAVARVGGVQGRFFVGVLGIFLAKIVEALSGGVGGNGLRQKGALVLLLHHQQQLDLERGVVARREHGLHHEAGLLEHLVARVVLQKAVGEVGSEQTASAEDDDENQGEFGEKFHGCAAAFDESNNDSADNDAFQQKRPLCPRRRAIIFHMPPMKPMFLPDVEHNPKPGPFRNQVQAMQATGGEYPKIWHMFAYLPAATEHLAQFTQEIMRGPAPISPGLRELIAAYTSYHNDCPF